jgi:PAS domain S-box-containing protein
MSSNNTTLTSLELKSAIIPNPLIVLPDTTVKDAIAQMSGVRLCCDTNRTNDTGLDELHLEALSSCVLVMENNLVVGILTERDVVRLSAEKKQLDCLCIGEVMAKPVVTLHESAFTDLFFSINLLKKHNIRHLPIIDAENRLMGIVTHESLRKISRPTDLLRLRLVTEVMSENVIYAPPTSSILSIAKQMAEHRVSSVVIVKTDDPSHESVMMPIGIITERDVVQFHALELNLESCIAEAVMSTPIFAVQPEESLWAVQQVMEQRFVRRLVVMGTQGELLGIVTQSSILQALNPLELYNLADVLEKKVMRLEAEKVALLESRTVELERQQATTYDQLQAELNERRQAEVRLRESEQRYATLAATAPVGIFRTDAIGHCIYVNDYYCQITGFTPEIALGQGWEQGVHSDDRESVLTAWQRSIQANCPFQLEYRFQHRRNKVIWVYAQSIAERDTDGVIIGYVGTVTDISARKQAEYELQQLNQALEA